MERVNRLLRDPVYLECMEKNRVCELDRIYCRHDLSHALDVARIAAILNLEEQLGFDREILYAMALVHDMGRWQEYESGIPHNRASAALAEDLLRRCGFGEAERTAMLQAVGVHRRGDAENPLSDLLSALLSALLYRADKLSRNCPCCAAIKTCKHFLNGEEPCLRY
jgi:HD superfamily phosphodiesterase